MLRGSRAHVILQHAGTMKPRGAATRDHRQSLTQATGDLKGISGKMSITIAPDGEHSYDLEYELRTPSRNVPMMSPADP